MEINLAWIDTSAERSQVRSMSGLVLISAILATWLIVGVVYIGRKLHAQELATGIAPKGTDALIFGACALMLLGLYFADHHPVIGNTVAIITGFVGALGYLFVASWIVRFLAQALHQKR